MSYIRRRGPHAQRRPPPSPLPSPSSTPHFLPLLRSAQNDGPDSRRTSRGVSSRVMEVCARPPVCRDGQPLGLGRYGWRPAWGWRPHPPAVPPVAAAMALRPPGAVLNGVRREPSSPLSLPPPTPRLRSWFFNFTKEVYVPAARQATRRLVDGLSRAASHGVACADRDLLVKREKK